jgi:tetratricopeptide (TPR) repeat protein
LDEAMAYFEEALRVKILALLGGEDKHHEEVANGLHNMGIVHDDLQEYDRSIECYREALDIRIMLFDGNNEREEVADTWQCMGNVYLAEQELDDALHSF